MYARLDIAFSNYPLINIWIKNVSYKNSQTLSMQVVKFSRFLKIGRVFKNMLGVSWFLPKIFECSVSIILLV